MGMSEGSREAVEALNASDPAGMYEDLADVESAIRAYGSAIHPGQVLGFARVVQTFVPSWSREACARFVEDVAADEAEPTLAPRWPQRVNRAAVGMVAAALAVGAITGGAVAAGVSQVGGPARVTLDTSSFEDGSERALVRLVVPAGVSQVRVQRALQRHTGGRVVSFVVGYCRSGGVCEEAKR